MSTASQLLTEAQKGPQEFNEQHFLELFRIATPQDLRSTNEDDQTLHMLLAYNGHERAFNALRSRCPPDVIRRESYEGRVLAHFAIQHADFASRHAKARILNDILSMEADPNAVDNHTMMIDPQRAPRSLLDYAINEGCPTCIRVLLKHHATVTEQEVEAARVKATKTSGDARHMALRKQVHKLLARALVPARAAA